MYTTTNTGANNKAIIASNPGVTPITPSKDWSLLH